MRDNKFFTHPELEWQRRYEALRASFVERLPHKVVAEKFGYSPGYVRLLRHKLSELNTKHDVKFITLRRRGKNLIAQFDRLDNWKRIQILHSKRKYPHVRVHESFATLRGYDEESCKGKPTFFGRAAGGNLRERADVRPSPRTPDAAPVESIDAPVLEKDDNPQKQRLSRCVKKI